MKPTRILALATAAMTAIVLSATTSESMAQSGAVELNIGSLAPKGTPWMALLEKMEAQIEADSGNRINVIIRPPGAMSEIDLVRETHTGERLQGCAVTTAAIAEGGNIPVLSLIELPFLFNSNVETDHVLDSVLFKPVNELMGKQGFTLAVWSENGWRSFGNKGEPIQTPDDLKQYKMRSQQSPVHMEMYKAFGVQAVQNPATEVLTALQSSVIDGLDNTPLYLQSTGLAESLDSFSLTKHIYQPAAVVYSKRWFDKLPPDLRAILLKPKTMAADGRQDIRDEDEAVLETMSLFSVEVVELTDAEREAFAKKGRTMHASYAASIDGGTEFLGTITSALDSLRK